MMNISSHHSRIVCLAAASVIFTVTGCGSAAGDRASDEPDQSTVVTTAEESAFPMTVEDCGREIVLDARPERVLTIGATPLQLLHAAGAVDAVVGRAGEYGTAPDGPVANAVADVPIIAEEDPALEVIIDLDPDLVLSYGLYSTTAEDLDAAGIASVVTQASCSVIDENAGPPSLDDVFADIELYGAIFGTSETAAAAVDDMQSAVDTSVDQASDVPYETAAAVYVTEGVLSAHGNRHVLHDVFARFGLENAFGDLASAYADPTIEELIARDPEVIVVTYGWYGEETAEEAIADFEVLPGASDLTAVTEGRVTGLHFSQIEPQPLLIEGIEQLGNWLAGTT